MTSTEIHNDLLDKLEAAFQATFQTNDISPLGMASEALHIIYRDYVIQPRPPGPPDPPIVRNRPKEFA